MICQIFTSSENEGTRTFGAKVTSTFVTCSFETFDFVYEGKEMSFMGLKVMTLDA